MSPLLAAPRVQSQALEDGAILLSPVDALGAYPRAVGVWLEHWAQHAPERSFIARRSASGQWRRLSYGETLATVRRLATALLDNAKQRPGPIAVLSGNGIEHALLVLSAMHVGIPVASISPAYSLASKDHAKLKRLIAELQPGLIYAETHDYHPALDAIVDEHRAKRVCSDPGSVPIDAFESLLEREDAQAVAASFAAVGPDSVAKILYTSGSTGEPKGVINTQRMLCASQQAKAQVWPFLEHRPPVIVDWLPWSHTFGANHNFNLVLRNGGTLYIDDGRPMPELFEQSRINLMEVCPNLYFNVPKGYDLLVASLRSNVDFRERFFSRVELLFYAAAALPQHLWEALMALSEETLGRAIPMVSAWGTTETSPLATDCHFQAPWSGNIGVPVPGCELKLLPVGEGRFEIRVRGPNITPGYFRRPQQTAEAFDEAGFYITGDAVRFAQDGNADAGLIFGGRLSEDFKLSSGTWVRVGATRIRAIECLSPIAQDIVIAGHDRDHLAFLVFPALAACRKVSGLGERVSDAEVLASEAVRDKLRDGLQALRAQGGGSSMHAPRAVLLQEPPDVDSGEITDKGYINQGAVLTRRAALVDDLFADPAPADVVQI